MRCKNCGWENPDSCAECEKCHASLKSESSLDSSNQSTSPLSDRMKSTVAERVVFNDDASVGVAAPASCPMCGYPVAAGCTSCPNCNHELVQSPTVNQNMKCKACGAEIAPESKFCSSCGKSVSENPANGTPARRVVQRASMGTVLGGPISGPMAQTGEFCTLRPIAWQGEDVNYNPVTYSGNTIILNRSNTDANNNSITSKEQAVLTFEDGDWYIENRSELRTTFIRVNGRVKLTSGDIIVLGNREFEFKG